MTPGELACALRLMKPDGLSSEPTDGQLLERFLTTGDGEAFAALVRRHGPMVLGACRRMLGHEHDAEEAFQTTFLVLLRKAAALRTRDSLGGWLHAVACHTGRKAREARRRRAAIEAQARPTLTQSPAGPERRELWAVLDEELAALDCRYREAVILCDLEGNTRREAARQLGVPEGTLSGRLTTARRLLARRLARRGLALSSLALASTIVPARLLARTPEILAGRVPAGVVRLAEGVLRAMNLNRWKMLTAAGLLGLALVGGMAALLASAPAPPPAGPGKGGPRNEKTEDVVLALEKRRCDLGDKQDARAIKELVADDFVGISWGQRYSKEALLEHIRQHRITTLRVRAEQVMVLNDNTAVVIYEADFQAISKNGEKESTTRTLSSTWVRRDGKWKNVLLHDTLVKDR